MLVETGGSIPLKIWTDSAEEGALEQARHLTDLPFAFKHVALMPDCHLGYGMPIGGVLSTIGVVVPNAVGLDCGCGIRAWNTNARVEDFLPVRDAVMQEVRKAVPVGFSWHEKAQEAEGLFDDVADLPVVQGQREKAMKQLGTLGGGNHYLEVDVDECGIVWVTIHSGSRNLGKQVADHYNKIAVALNAKWHSVVPKEHELAFLPLDIDEGKLYMAEMQKCLDFARLNRKHMMDAVEKAFLAAGLLGIEAAREDLDVHHNYASFEHCFGKNVLVHRKGAVRAVGTVIIPGSMGSHSYIAEGLENPDSFKSCSHGAGRAMGRKAAVRDLPAASQAEEMRERDIKLYGGGRGNEWVAESKLAYKPIDDVMANQSDLVRPLIKLSPLAVLKA